MKASAAPPYLHTAEWLVSLYYEGEHARDWYDQAQLTCSGMAESFGLSLEQVAGIVSALSPRVRWHKNVEYARRFIRGERVPVFSTSRRNAQRILDGEHPLDVMRGPKTRAFYSNLIGDLRHVTCDVWACRAVGEERKPAGRVYEEVSELYILASEMVGCAPAQMQAAVWAAVRGSGE